MSARCRIGSARCRIGGASVRGAAHLRDGRPNQDALLWTPPSGEGSRVIGAVADGHGARVHYRSDIGSRLAVESAVELIDWYLDDPDQEESGLASEIVGLWRRRVAAHAAVHPDPLGPADAYSPYGATLIALGAAGGQLILAQIGDGDLLLGFPDGRIERPLGADAGLRGEETYSLCLDQAEQRFRISTLWSGESLQWPDFAMLASDGVAKSFRDEEAYLSVIAQLRELARNAWDQTLSGLPDWLSALSATGSGDDSTACLMLIDCPAADHEKETQ